MCLKVIVTALEMGNFSHVVNYVSKAEQTPDASAQIQAKLRIATGLAHLHNRKYKSAARSFLDAAPDMGGNSFSEVLSTQDVGIYGGMCALAQFDRNELKRHVISNPRFKSFLDQTPELQALVNAFYNCRYTEALGCLERLRPRLAIDPHLAEHAALLSRQIRNRAIVQFFSPYSSVDMKMMATAFNTTVAELEQELKNLIVEGDISARIDSFNQVLVAKQVNQRTRMFQKATEVGRDHNANMRDMLLRMDLTMQEFSVKPPRRGGPAGGGGGAGAGGGGGGGGGGGMGMGMMMGGFGAGGKRNH
jgi:COP9 signalosome complex subunit 1